MNIVWRKNLVVLILCHTKIYSVSILEQEKISYYWIKFQVKTQKKQLGLFIQIIKHRLSIKKIMKADSNLRILNQTLKLLVINIQKNQRK